jgi:CubicO group peptidase (beta-lactamase class C family)
MKKITVWLLLAAVLLSVTPVAAFAEDRTLPSGIVYSDAEKTIDNFVSDYRETTAAVSIAVFNRDGIIHEKSYGYADVEGNVQNDADTVFEWGSVTKLLVWVSAMQLVEQGRLDLNADIRTYLPNNFLKRLKNDKITMINLMNHDAGWQDVLVEFWFPDRENIRSLESWLKIAEPVQIFRSGEYSAYSNYGAALAGYIVERISGVPFYEYVQANIFSPLGMNQTALSPDLSDNPRVKSRREKLMCYTTAMQPLGSRNYAAIAYPAGLAIGTISDFRKFGMALLPDENGASPLFEKAETLSEMYVPTKYFFDGVTAANCHGFWHEVLLQNNVIGHSGNTLGCSSRLLIDPVAGVGAVVMTNQYDEQVYNYKMMISEIFCEKDIRIKDNLPEDDGVTGIYYFSQGFTKGIYRIRSTLGMMNVIKNKDGGISATAALPIDDVEIPLVQVEPGVYKFTKGEIIMLLYANKDSNGNVRSLSWGIAEIIRTSWGALIFDFFLLLSLVVAGIYGLIALIIMLIRKSRKRKQPMAVLRAAVCGSVIAALINFMVLNFWPSSSITTFASTLNTHCILFILFALIPVAYTVFLVVKFKSPDADKKQKRRLITSAVMGLLMTFSVVFLQLWYF